MFSIEQAMADFFDNSGGGGILYGGTGQTGTITGNPTGGSGDGTSYTPAPRDEVTENGFHIVNGQTNIDENGNVIYYDIVIYAPKHSDLEYSTFDRVVHEFSDIANEFHRFVNGEGYGYICPHGGYWDDSRYHLRTVDEIFQGDDSAGSGKQTEGGAAPKITVSFGSDENDVIAGAGVLHGGAGDDTVLGAQADEALFGGMGNDRLEGGAGADMLDGGSGSDVMAGGAGDDVYFVDSVGDFVFELGNEGTDTVCSLVDFNIAAWAIENVSLLGFGNCSVVANWYDNVLAGSGGNNTILAAEGNDTVEGGGGSDSLVGGTGSDSLLGGAGNDTVLGGAGGDIVYGGEGADRLEGGSGNDTVSYFGAKGGVTVKLWANAASGDIAQGDAISGFENVSGGSGGDWLEGSNDGNVLDGCAGGDLLIGFGGNDLLFGREGDDTLIADWGTDILEGGSGNDLFAIWATTRHAIINDFAHGDHIQLATSLFAGFDALRSAAMQVGDDVVISGATLDITLRHVWLASLSASDFQFV